MKHRNRITCAIAGAYLSLGLLLGQGAVAAEIAGVKVSETATVANQQLLLNGAGIRYKAIFKVYVAALYLTEKKELVPDILTMTGPRRIAITMLRDVSSEEFGQSFMGGIQKNSDRAEKSKFVSQLLKFGEIFASVPELKKGDVLTNDWVPGTGLVITLNGKRLADPIPDIGFHNMLLKIWLGDKPADIKLKRQMLGDKSDETTRSY